MPKRTRPSLAERIRNLRREAGLTQQELAEAIGLGAASRVSAWENAHHRPSRTYLARLENVLGDLDGGDRRSASRLKSDSRRWGVRLLASQGELDRAARWLGWGIPRFGVDALRAVMTAPEVTQLDISTFSADDLLVRFSDGATTPLVEPEGVEVRLLLPARQDHNTVARFLEAYLATLDDREAWPAGVEIRCFPSATSADSRRILHAKILTAHTPDGLVHLFGSANFTRNGFLFNVETLALQTGGEDGVLAETFDTAWDAATVLTRVAEATGLPVVPVMARPEIRGGERGCARDSGRRNSLRGPWQRRPRREEKNGKVSNACTLDLGLQVPRGLGAEVSAQGVVRQEEEGRDQDDQEVGGVEGHHDRGGTRGKRPHPPVSRDSAQNTPCRP